MDEPPEEKKDERTDAEGLLSVQNTISPVINVCSLHMRICRVPYIT